MVVLVWLSSNYLIIGGREKSTERILILLMRSIYAPTTRVFLSWFPAFFFIRQKKIKLKNIYSNMSFLGKRSYQGMLGDRRPNVGPLLPPSMGGGFRRTKRPMYAARKFTGNVRAVPQQELKFFDTALSFSLDATTEVPATGQLTLIPQGDTGSSRDGRMAYIRSIAIEAIANLVPAAAATAADVMYMWLVLDQQTNGAAAAATDVLTSSTASTALPNLVNSRRFRVLKRWRIDFNPGAGATAAINNCIHHIKFYQKCNIPVTFNGTTGAITEIRDNNVFLLAGSSGATDDLIAVQGTARLRFYD